MINDHHATEALGYLSAEFAARADAWNGNQPEWFPEPPEWLELWDKALRMTARYGRFRGWKYRSWPIRIRCALLIPGHWRWNAYVRDVTASAEGLRQARDTLRKLKEHFDVC